MKTTKPLQIPGIQGLMNLRLYLIKYFYSKDGSMCIKLQSQQWLHKLDSNELTAFCEAQMRHIFLNEIPGPWIP